MSISLEQLRQRVPKFDFAGVLIEELGWDRYHGEPSRVVVDGTEYLITPVAEKSGFAAFLCTSPNDGVIPPYDVRRKIESRVTKMSYEHLLIFIDKAKTIQIWQWARRRSGQPTLVREYTLRNGQTGEALIQRLQHLGFELEEQDSLTIASVSDRVKKALDVERVTKRYYDGFKNEHRKFLGFIKGIESIAERELYASIMLNRMMFVYFIQKKGMLDGDGNYLRNRLNKTKEIVGKNSFHRFYKFFLLRLFHEGLGQSEIERAQDLRFLLGKVPYLNGSLFTIHEIELKYKDIQIPDAAFEKIFSFFDTYRWHLDERSASADNEINPDVIGYIFEKYINQKQMGAYYTKEDITKHISERTILPWMLKRAFEIAPSSFRDKEGWEYVQHSGDKFIFEALKKGCERDLPGEISDGIADYSKRGIWNRMAESGYGLPNETWRECIARRTRYTELTKQIAAGQIRSVHEFIVKNLDIKKLVEELIVTTKSPEVVASFWTSLTEVTVLDPTCGSGAFLFAALNILESIYHACLERMQGFVDDGVGAGTHSAVLDFFKDTLGELTEHPNQRFYVLKTVILRNLYGVDIMKEAVEICKLRLFLKLASQLDRVDQVETLPDVDFNIRAGNTLVGFVTAKDGNRANPSGPKIDATTKKRAAATGVEFAEFRRLQMEGRDPKKIRAAKQRLREKTSDLRADLDKKLAQQYGIKVSEKKQFEEWRNSHQPFHWFAEFYEIMESGGFRAIIGNPPYVEYGEVKDTYTVQDYATESCGNLYAFVWERCLELSDSGHIAMIVPVAAVCTDGYKELQELLRSHGSCVVSNYNDRPSKLFDGLEHIRLCIVLLEKVTKKHPVYSTTYNKWQSVERPFLFELLSFGDASQFSLGTGIPKIGSSLERSILSKYYSKPLISYEKKGKYVVYYTRKLSHFVQILNFIPSIRDGQNRKREPSELKEIRFGTEEEKDIALSIWNSSLFYWLLNVYSDCRNLNKREIELARFDFANASKENIADLMKHSQDLMVDVKKNSKTLTMAYKDHGVMKIQCTYPRFSKEIIDRIDRCLAEHYGLTEEELDFIINYDIKYRLGHEGENEEEDRKAG